MVIEFYNLGFNLYHAENAQSAQSIFNVQERGSNAIATDKTQESGKAEQSGLVQDTKEVENRSVDAEGSGGNAYSSASGEEEKEKKEKGEKSPPDPGGRGQLLDLEM